MDYKKRDPVTIIILSVITCGIYALYWQWVTNKQINDLLGREAVGDGTLILGWFCPPLQWYNWYKWDQSLQEIAADSGHTYSSNFILWVVLSVLAGLGYIVSMFQIQETLNILYDI